MSHHQWNRFHRSYKYIDYYLQTLVMGIPSFVKDTKQVINTLREIQWKQGYFLATADVASLYTVISHDFGYQAVQHFLD